MQAQVQKLESQRQAAVDQEKARLAIEALKQKEVDEKKRQTLAKMKEAKALTQAEEIVAQVCMHYVCWARVCSDLA